MNVKEYLKQGRLLDQRINFNLRRLQEMKSGICSLSSPQIKADKVQTSPDGDAPFVKALMRFEEMQEHINRQIDLLVDLKQQIDDVIHSVESSEYQLLLLYRYIEHRTWEEIGISLGVGKTTVKRWHQEALQMVKLPENPIDIKSIW